MTHAALRCFYRDGLGLPELDRVAGHAGYPGVMLGLPGLRYHLEFTQHDHGSPDPAPSRDNLLVLYFGDLSQVGHIGRRLAALGHLPVEAENPYWTENGAVTVEDPDGWRVVLMPRPPECLAEAGPVIRLGVPADRPAVSDVYRRASLSNAGDRDNLLAHPEYLVLRAWPKVAPMSRSRKGRLPASPPGARPTASTNWTTCLSIQAGGGAGSPPRSWTTLRRFCARGVQRLEVTANPHAVEFYRAAGFTACGVADTAFGAAQRMMLAIR